MVTGLYSLPLGLDQPLHTCFMIWLCRAIRLHQLEDLRALGHAKTTVSHEPLTSRRVGLPTTLGRSEIASHRK